MFMLRPMIPISHYIIHISTMSLRGPFLLVFLCKKYNSLHPLFCPAIAFPPSEWEFKDPLACSMKASRVSH